MLIKPKCLFLMIIGQTFPHTPSELEFTMSQSLVYVANISEKVILHWSSKNPRGIKFVEIKDSQINQFNQIYRCPIPFNWGSMKYNPA